MKVRIPSIVIHVAVVIGVILGFWVQLGKRDPEREVPDPA